MPLSELFRLATRQLQSSQKKSCPFENSARGENDLVELVWENGQIKTQSQSSRATGSPSRDRLNRIRDARAGHAMAARIGKFGGVQSVLDDMSPPVPMGDLDLSQGDDAVPWLRSYPLGDALPRDYSSDLFTGISSVTANGLSTQNSFASVDKIGSKCDQAVGNLQSGGNGNSLKASSSSTSRMLCSWPSLHCQTSDALGSSGLDNVSGNNASTKAEMPKNVRMPTNNSNLVNFSHFSRPAAIVSSKLPASLGVERVEIKEMGSSACGNNVVESGLIASSVNLPMVDPTQLGVRVPDEVSPPERIEDTCREIKNNSTAEPGVAASSVCSGNGAKRKFCDLEDSECRSDDLDTESTGITKPAPGRGGSGSKRSRAAEVHNLSERRRRDRINERMRALQELIPNCSWVDKASMLDEAIEYLKNLQLQVQIMSMSAGLCVPRMMFPTGMQHMNPHFSPMGIGMGYGMGMPDMNGTTPGCPVFPMPPLMQQSGCFPSPISGLNNFQTVPTPSLPVYGHLDQGLHSSVLKPPAVPLTGQPPIDSAMGLSSLRNESGNEVPSASPTLSNEDPM